MTEHHGRLRIEWPESDGTVLSAHGVALYDGHTGEQIVDAVALQIHLGSAAGWDDKLISVVLTRLVDYEGIPIGSRTSPTLTEEFAAHLRDGVTGEFVGQKRRTAEFSYLVSEMSVRKGASV